MRKWIPGLLCLSIALQGCTSDLGIKKIAIGSTADGYPYQLRYTQFDVALTWRITGCDTSLPNPLKFKITAEVTAKTPLDPDQLYSIDPASLQGPFRSTEFAMDWYDDRGTKSINSSVDDQTGTAIVNILTGVGKLAGAGLLPAGNTTICPAAVVKALDDINGVGGADGQKAVTEKAQKAVDEQTLKLSRVTARAAALGAAVDAQTRNELGQEQRTLEALKNVLTLEQAKLKSLLEVVTDTRTVTWPNDGLTFESDASAPYRPSAKASKDWSLASTSKGVDVYLRLLPRDTLLLPQNVVDGKPPAPAPIYAGLPYREPRAMRLYICSGAPCGTDRAQLDTSEQLVKTADAQVFQGGTTFLLPFKARTFASIKNSAGFNQAGVLVSAGSGQPRGAGSGAADAFKGGGEQISGIVTAARGAETARLKALAEEAKAKKELADAEKALQPVVNEPVANADKLAAIAAFQVDATLAAAERAKIEAEAALALARQQQAQ